MPPLLVRDGVRRDGFLATLGSRTWRSRAVTAGVLADVGALASRGAYSAWLRRSADAWSCLPTPALDGGQGWPLVTVGPDCLDGRSVLAADLADLADPGATTPIAPGDRHAVDEAFLVGAAYVAVVAATDAAVLTEAALALQAREQRPVGVRFLLRCSELARARAALRRELASWAADREPEARERAVLTARTLSLDLAEALRH